MFKKIFFVCLFICQLPFTILAQNERANYQLLWKISGNGLSSPSYLFGTMHLREERVFDFSDSVLVSLLQCKGFAMEVLPDSALATQIMNYFSKRNTSSNSLRKSLSAEEYKKLTLLLKNEGKSVSELDEESPEHVLSLLKRTKPNKREQSTFLDAYLYRVALGEKKQTIGLEDLKDQIDLLNGEDDIAALKGFLQGNDTENQENEFINNYWKGDLGILEKYFVGLDQEYLDKLLIRRNANMVEKAIPNMQEKSFFIAVGAAHLPGEKGMIQLFREKGYTVTLVPASFTGMAKKYKEKPFAEAWIKYEVPAMGYSIEAPSYPAQVDSRSEGGVPTKTNLSADIKTGLFYFYTAVQTPERSVEESDKVLSEIFKRLKSKDSKNISRKITYKGYTGREGLIQNKGIYLKVRAIERKNCLYMIMAGSQVESALGNSDVDRFFESLQFLEFSNPDWNTFNSEEGAFSIKTPHAFQEQNINKEVAAGREVRTHLYLSGDLVKGIEYVLAYYEFSPGLVSNNDSLTYDNTIKGFSEIIKGKNIKSEDTWLGEYSGKKYTFDMEGNRQGEGRLYMRGNRLYNLLTVFPNTIADKKDIYAFMESFRFEKFKQPELKSYTNDAYQFTVLVPSEVVADIDSTGSPKNDVFNFQDPGSASAYLVSVLQLSPYDYILPDSLASRIKQDYIGEDSILSTKKISINGMKGFSFLIRQKNTHSLKRIQVVPKDDKLYMGFGYFPPADSVSVVTKTFFSSFKFTEQNPTTSVYANKTEKLLKDITSDDSTKRDEAARHLYGYTFQAEEIVPLKAAIIKSYHDDTTLYGTRQRLINALFRTADTGKVSFAKQLYPTLKAHPNLQMHLLDKLIDHRSQEGIQFTYKVLSEAIPEVSSIPYSFFYPLKDSIQLGEKNFPDLYFLANQPLFSEEVYSLASTLLDSNRISTQFFANDLDAIVKKSNSLLEEVKKGKVDEEYEKISLLKVYAGFLKHFSAKPLIDQFFTSLAKDKNSELVIKGVEGLLNVKQNIPTSAVDKLASNPEYRIALFELMKKANREQLIPMKYRTQQQMAEGYLSTYVLYEELGTCKFKFVKVAERNYKTKRSKFYLFKVISGKEVYPALVGPFELDADKITITNEATAIQYEEFDESKLDAYFETLLGE